LSVVLVGDYNGYSKRWVFRCRLKELKEVSCLMWVE